VTTSVVKSTTSMATGTVVSRLTGFLRDMVIAGAIGTAIFADTYNVANTIPNIIYILLVGGALNAVLIPQLTRAMSTDEDGGAAYTNRILTSTMLVLLGVTVVAVLAAPLIIRLYAWTYTGGDTVAEFDVAVTFARYLLPQILFYGLFVMLGQVLNARGSFGPMMWAPIVNNVVVVATGLLFIVVTGANKPTAESVTSGELRLLGIGTTLGVIAQAAILIPVLTRLGFRFKPRFDFRRTGLGRAYKAAFWTIVFVLVNQIGYLVVVQVATAVGTAAEEAGIATGVGFTPYTKAYLILLLPHAVITVSIVTALLPRMSRAAAAGVSTAVRLDISEGLRLIGVALVPAAVAFLVLGRDVATVMYDGFVGIDNAEYIGWVLMAFALGIIPFSIHHLLLRGFYAFEDTRTPVRINVWINAVNITAVLVAWWLLPTHWVVVGMAAGYALSYAIGVAITARTLSTRLGGLDGRNIAHTYSLLAFAAIAAALPAAALAWGLRVTVGRGLGTSIAALVVGGGLMIGLYLVFCFKLRISEFAKLVSLLRRPRA
jgi:putative peptidoglycan lipid II flippase